MSQFRPTRMEQLPPAIKNIIIVSVIFFLAQITIQPKFGFDVERHFALHSVFSDFYKPWQFVTSFFLNYNFLSLFLSMLGLWMLGTMLESLWGTKKFLVFFLSCTIGGSLFFVIYDLIMNYQSFLTFKELTEDVREGLKSQGNLVFDIPTILSCSSGVFGCFVAFTYLNPDAIFYFYFIIPMKAKWMLAISIVFQVISFISTPSILRGSIVANLGGALIGFILVYYWNKSRRTMFN